MADLERLSVRALRDLARKHVGPGYTRLKTRRQLIDALAKAMPAAAPEKAPAAAAAAPPTPAKAPSRANGKRPPPPAPASPAPKAEPARPARAKKAAPRAGPPARPVAVPPPPPLPPLPSGFDEQLGELPESYGDDSVVLLPKDPHALYLYWDLSPATLDRAFAWMPGLRTRLRLLEGDRIVREVEFAVSARSWYFFNLPSGRTFRAEMLAFADDGQVRRIGPKSNPARLPGAGPSAVRDDRFVRIPLDLAPSRVAEALRHEIPQPPPQGPRGPVAPPPRGGPGAPPPPPPPPRPEPARHAAGRPAAGPTLRARHAMPVSAPGAQARALAPGLEALIHLVELPPFTETRRERIYRASGGTARPAGSSDVILAPRGDG